MKSTKTLTALALAALLSSTAVLADAMKAADVHAQRADLSGKQVTVTGKVVKVNNGIMRRNFVHVQDGETDNDRVIFTSKATANVGDQVTATGTVKLDTDFGMGYFYATLVEDASFAPAN